MRKKLFGAILCGFLVFSLAGCGNDAESDRGSFSVDGFNAEKVEKNISVSAEGIASDKTLVAIVKNNNNSSVEVEVEAVFYDADGNSLGSDTAYLYIDKKQEMACNFYNVPKNYSDYEINIKANDPVYTNYSDKVEVKDNDTGEQLAVQVKNNAGKDIESVDVAVVFYQGDKIVGFGSDLATDLRKDQTSTSNIYYPYDENYDDITYDSYKVFVSAYNFEI